MRKRNLVHAPKVSIGCTAHYDEGSGLLPGPFLFLYAAGIQKALRRRSVMRCWVQLT